MTQPRDWKREFWPIIRGLVTVVCSRCDGFECHFCESKGVIYINQDFKRYHEKVESFIDSLLAEKYSSHIEAVRRVGELEKQLAEQRQSVLEEAAKVAEFEKYYSETFETQITHNKICEEIAKAIRGLGEKK